MHRSIVRLTQAGRRHGALPPEAAARLRYSVERQVEQFRNVYGHCGSDVLSLQEWMQTYYRRPRPDLLVGAWAIASKIPGALTGDAALSGAVFMSHIVLNFQQEKHLHSSLEVLNAASRMRNGTTSESSSGENSTKDSDLRSAELTETLYRAMYLANRPAFDRRLEAVSSRWLASLSETVDSDDELAALAQSLFPPPKERIRVPLLEWPIPALSLAVFELHVTRSRYPIYAVTRYLFSGTHAAYLLAKKSDLMRLAQLLPQLATVVTMSMVDGLWAEFYATGNPKAIIRILDVGTPYMDFIEEYGVLPVTGYKNELNARRGAPAVTLTSGWGDPAASGLAEEFVSDPYSRMRFETSRYALWTLLIHSSTHTSVGDTLLQHSAMTEDRVAMFGPFGAEEEGAMTAHGRTQLLLLKAIMPSIASLRRHSEAGGIGSGHWPASYPEPGKSSPSTPRQLADGNPLTGLHALPSLESEDVKVESDPPR